MIQTEEARSTTGAMLEGFPLSGLQTRTAWLVGLGAILVVLVISLLMWGPGMEFPTTVSTSEVATSGGGSVTLTKTVRQVTGNVIDEAVDWLTVEGSWLFNGLSDGVSYALIFIEDILKWIPWPRWCSGSRCCHTPSDAGPCSGSRRSRCFSWDSWDCGRTPWPRLR